MWALFALSGCGLAGTSMPNLEGLTALDAKLKLAELGIEYVAKDVPSEEAQDGLVLQTSPESGAPVTGPVEVVVGTGPEYVAPKVTPTAEPIWWPTGFQKFNKDVAYRFITDSYRGDPCGYSECSYWVVEVVSRSGCSDGLYGKLNILRDGRIVDWTNDNLAGISVGQVGELMFKSYGLGGGSYSGEIVEFNCYG
jgi:hypothetical protein